jgi:hypothetical protein
MGYDSHAPAGAQLRRVACPAREPTAGKAIVVALRAPAFLFRGIALRLGSQSRPSLSVTSFIFERQCHCFLIKAPVLASTVTTSLALEREGP